MEPSVFQEIKEALDRGQVLHVVVLGHQGRLTQAREAAASAVGVAREAHDKEVGAANKAFDAAVERAQTHRDRVVAEADGRLQAVVAAQDDVVDAASAELAVATAELNAVSQELTKRFGIPDIIAPPAGGGSTRL